MYRLLPLLCCAAFAGCIEYFPELPDLGPVADDGMPDVIPDVIPEAGMPDVMPDVMPDAMSDAMPETGMSDAMPETGMPDVMVDAMPDADVPDADVPDADVPDVMSPDMCIPGDEICNDIDDDCDGASDEGAPDCERGCDAVDDDGDGRTDEGCDAVTCDGLGALPPCNGGPDGLEIPSGWVYIPPGEALLGSPEAELGPVDERPQQPARISRGLLMMQTEMTQGMWRALAADDPIAQGSPSYFDGVDGRICDAEAPDECPVERISWIDAAWAANALSDRDGLTRCYAPAQLDALAGCNGPVGSGCDPGDSDCARQGCNVVPLEALHDLDPACDGYRLPTSAEWTYAARGGSQTQYWPGDGVGDLAAVDWYEANAGGHTHRVGRPLRPAVGRFAHPWGLYDMHGNVAEWVHDGYGPLPDPAPDQPMVDPLLLTYSADARVLRGGAWDTETAAGCRLAIRAPLSASRRNWALGVRFVRTVNPRPASGPRIASLTGAGGVAPPLDTLLPGDTVTLEAEVTVEGGGDGGPLTGALYLIARPPGERARSVEVGRFEDEGERWRVTIPWEVINAAGPGQFAPGVGDVRRFAARFSDAAGRGHHAYIRLTFGCEADGQPAHLCDGVCRDAPGVACDKICDGPPDDAGPPCNGCPAGTVVPDGWVCAPAGDFVMGSPPDEPGRGGSAEDQVAVRLTTPFLISEAEATQAEWQAAFGNNPSFHQPCPADPPARPGGCPVEQVTWYEALAYANHLTDETAGLVRCYELVGCDSEPGEGMVCDPDVTRIDGCTGFRLPSEAEWEYAARAGTVTAYSLGPDEADLAASDWYASNSAGHPEAVCGRVPNPWGLCDVHGNVREWVDDDAEDYPEPNGDQPLIDPRGGPFGPNRVHRGGTYGTNAAASRSAYRSRSLPEAPSLQRGFRLVRDLPPPARR